jgi:alkaline phosphatase D
MKIAVASCAKLRDVPDQPAWSEIQQEQPDVLLLIGDNIYLKVDQHTDPAKLTAELRRRYAEQFAERHFKALLADLKKRKAKVIPIYDDHDFLGNDRCGGDVPVALRRAARSEFIRTFKPQQTGNAVYSVARLGLVDIVVLDGRYYRKAPTQPQVQDRDAFLGPGQWQWLETTLAEPSPAKYTVVVSGTTFHDFGGESWEPYTAAFNRMCDLLKGRSGTLITSGDIHRNTMYDDTGVMELVTSAVARLGATNKAPRKNYGILTFNEDGMHVDLRSLQLRGRFDFTVPLANWALP